MHVLDETKVADGVASESWCKVLCKGLELPQRFTQIKLGNVVHDVKQRYAGARIVDCLEERK